MLIPIKTFAGEFPRKAPRLLPDTAATLAMNVDLSDQQLRGQLENVVVPFAQVPGVVSGFVYRTGTEDYLGTWYVWDRDVDALRSPVTDDQYYRFYWMDGSEFCVSQGDRGAYQEPQATNKWRVGVPQPSAAPAVTTTIDWSRTLNPNPFLIGGITYTPVSYNPDGSMNGTMNGTTPDGRVFNNAVFRNATRRDGMAIGMSQTLIDQYFHENLALYSDSFSINVGQVIVPVRYYPNGSVDFTVNGVLLPDTTYAEAIGPTINCPIQLADAIWNWTPPASFAKILTVSFVIANERADGSTFGDVSVGVVPPDDISSDISKTYTFTPAGFAPDAGGTASTVTSLPPEYQVSGSVFLNDFGQTITVYFKSGIYYFKADLPSPATELNVTLNGVFNMQFWNIPNSQWYASDTNQLAPTETTTTTGGSIGQLVTATITLATGIVITAKIRANATDSNIPIDIDGMSADFTANDDGSYMVNLWVQQTNIEARGYVYTYVNIWGEEGAPSDPTVLDTVIDGLCYIKFSAPPASIVGYGSNNAGGYAPIAKVRIYRTSTGSQGTNFLFAKEIAYTADLDTLDDVSNAYLGEALLTGGYLPPDQDLAGLRQMANGVFVAFKGKEIHFSESYLPYAWKRANIKQVPAKVMGICPFETSLYVTTVESPVIFSGLSADSMTESQLPSIQAGVSKNSIVDMGQFIAWASPDGIVVARGLDVSLEISQRFWTRDTWRDFCRDDSGAIVMSKIEMRAHNGYLLLWFSDGRVIDAATGTRGLLLRYEGEVTLTRTNDYIMGAIVHPESDGVYISNGQAMYEYMAGPERKAFSWQSKEFYIPSPTNFGAIQLIGDGTVEVAVTCNTTHTHTFTATLTNTDQDIFRLPPGFKGHRWQIRVDGAAGATVMEINLANSISEFNNA